MRGPGAPSRVRTSAWSRRSCSSSSSGLSTAPNARAFGQPVEDLQFLVQTPSTRGQVPTGLPPHPEQGRDDRDESDDPRLHSSQPPRVSDQLGGRRSPNSRCGLRHLDSAQRAGSSYAAHGSLGRTPEPVRTNGQGRTIVGQYGSSPRQKQNFGKVDPFVLFAVLPTLVIAALFIWGDIAILGIVLILLAGLVVVFDAWTNRPSGTSAPRFRRNL